jgi:hypothetical protein
VLAPRPHDHNRAIQSRRGLAEHGESAGLDPELCIEGALGRLSTTKAADIATLTPWAWAAAILWKLLLVAEKNFRRLDAPELLPSVAAGEAYVNGVRKQRSRTHAA